MKETIKKLDTAMIAWEMEASSIYVAKADEVRARATLPTTIMDTVRERLDIRYDLPLLVETEKKTVAPKVEVELPKAPKVKS